MAIDTSAGPRRGAIYLTWADYADGMLGPYTGTIDEGEPNDFFAQAKPIQVGQDVNGVSYSYEFAGGDDCDYFYFDGVAGEMVEIHGVVNATSPAAPSTWTAGISLFCGADTSSLTRLAFKDMKLPGTGAIPIVVATLPKMGRYYLFTGCSDYYSYAYTLSLREWVPSGAEVSHDSRDVVLVRSTDGGQSWSSKVRVNDSPAGVDDCLPRVAVDGAGRVHVAWYDRRDDPGCGSIAKTYWTHSDDGGISFAPSVALSSVGSNWLALGSNSLATVGDFLGLAASGTGAYVAWVDARGPDPDLYRAIITDQATAAYAAQVSCLWTGAAVMLDYRLPAGLPAGSVSVQRTGGAGAPVVLTSGRSPLEGAYSLEDRDVAPGASYTYTVLLDQGSPGKLTLGTATITIPGAVTKLELGRPEPNPSSGQVKVRLGLPDDRVATVSLYNVAGQRVRRLVSGALHAGAQDLLWDGRDDAGRPLPSGVYFVRVQAGREQLSREVLRMQ
ncbi:MAG TPA: FlgD immunoglobulin-like domain containing protein [Candidatus Eisenbacteria bacterium]|nr:FlgD immunoglobulin-like domain containing protein [Candidatus Eisenbacteria bacterium]